MNATGYGSWRLALRGGGFRTLNSGRRLRRGLACALITLAAMVVLSAPAHASSGWVNPLTLFHANPTDPGAIAVNANGDALAVWPESNGANTIVQWAIRPAGGVFTAPAALSAPGQDASCPKLATDPAGDATAAWIRSNGTNKIVEAAYRPAGGSFSSPVDLSAPGADASCPSVATDAHGGSTVAWIRGTGSSATIEAASRPSGGGFAPAVDVTTPGPVSALELVEDAAGDATVVWRAATSPALIESASRPAGSTFGSPAVDSDPSLDAFDFAAAAAGNGTVTIAYATQTPGGSQDQVAVAIRTRDGFSSGGAGVLASSTAIMFGVSVAVNARGNAVAAWRTLNYGAGTESVQAAARPGPVAGWANPVSIHSGKVDTNIIGLSVLLSRGSPAVAVDANGDSTIAWETPANVVEATTGTPAGAFQATTTLSPLAETAGVPQMVADDAGDTIVAWSTPSGAPTTAPVRAAAKAAGGGFGSAAAIGPVGGALTGLAIDPNGDGVAAWANLDGSGSGVTGFEATPPQMVNVRTPGSGQAGAQLSFSAQATSVWSPVTLRWSWGDGTPDILGTTAVHTFRQGGSYSVTVSAIDSVGNVVGQTHTISIAAPPLPPAPPTLSLGSVVMSGADATLTFTCEAQPGGRCAGKALVETVERLRGGSPIALTARTKRHKRKGKHVPPTITRTVSVGSGAFDIDAGRIGLVRIALDAQGKMLLGRFYRMPATIMLTGTATASVPIVFAYRRVLSPVKWSVSYKLSSTTFTQLTVSALPSAAHVSMTCSGSGCPFRRRAARPRNHSASLAPLIAGSQLAPGSRLSVVIAAPNEVAKVVTFIIRSGALPTEITQCLPPGYRHPAACV